RSLHRPELTMQAVAALGVLTGKCRNDDGLFAHVCDPAGGTKGREFFLSDQANAATALLDAHEETGSMGYLTEARAIADRANVVFRDAFTGSLGDRVTDPNAPGLMSWPMRDLRDNMEMAKALVRLGQLTGERTYRDRARKTLESWADEAGSYEEHAATYAYAAQMLLTPPLQILVVADPNTAEGDRTRERALALYHPWRIVRHFGVEAGR